MVLRSHNRIPDVKKYNKHLLIIHDNVQASGDKLERYGYVSTTRKKTYLRVSFHKYLTIYLVLQSQDFKNEC